MGLAVRKMNMEEIITIGWKVLIERLGYANAIRFVMNTEKGIGDSVEEFQQMWEGKSIQQIHEEILKAKKEGVI